MTTNQTNQPALMSLMSQIISQGQQIAVVDEEERLRISAKTALDQYLSLPLSENDTFSFWRVYCQTNDRAQKSLAKLARIHLTPPPTSTDVERLFSTGMSKIFIY